MHRDIPQQFTDKWDEFKADASNILRECTGARDALQERVKLAQRNAAELLEKHGIEAQITKFGELQISRTFDPGRTFKSAIWTKIG